MGKGYGIMRDGNILPSTVGETAREALVNWLITYRGIMVFMSTTDEQIRNLYMLHAKEAGNVSLHRVSCMPGAPLNVEQLDLLIRNA